MTLSTQSLAMCPVLLFLSYFYRQITLCSHAERARGGFPRHSPDLCHLEISSLPPSSWGKWAALSQSSLTDHEQVYFQSL